MGLQLASGRIIALGRLLLATLFLVLSGIEAMKLHHFSTEGAALLLSYVALAMIIVVLTWRDWWLDAHLAGFTHVIDIIVFTLLVYLTNGDNNPFLTFSIFIFLAAAMRWGWRAMSLTAVLLALLFTLAGWTDAPPAQHIEFTDFFAGAGQLAILAVILVWFGINQRRAEIAAAAREREQLKVSGETAFEAALRAAMAQADAGRGSGYWRASGGTFAIVAIAGGALTMNVLDEGAVEAAAETPFLYDFDRAHALRRDKRTSLQAFDPTTIVPVKLRSSLTLREGLAIPVQTDSGAGLIFVEEISNLSTDHLELANRIGAIAAGQLERVALMRAAEEQAEARSRVAIARDLHDSVVQFLAGAAFRLEAMKRSESSGRAVTAELDELKELMLQEQGELRSFIAALRTGTQLQLAELATDLQGLTGRLSRQWAIQCTFSVSGGDIKIPSRLHLDAHQLVREGVANAVRHAGATTVSVRLSAADGQLRLEMINDGIAFPKSAGGQRLPGSLSERVAAAGGLIDLSRGMGVTRLSITLPTAEPTR